MNYATILKYGVKGMHKGMPLRGHPYHEKSDDQLRYIQRDAHEAAQAMRGVNPQAENKYLDQVNDASTVLHYRNQNGITKSEDHNYSKVLRK